MPTISFRDYTVNELFFKITKQDNSKLEQGWRNIIKNLPPPSIRQSGKHNYKQKCFDNFFYFQIHVSFQSTNKMACFFNLKGVFLLQN